MKVVFVILFNLLWYVAGSQNFLSWKYKDRFYSFSLGTGATAYFGELNHNYKLRKKFSHITSGIEARLLSKLGVRAELSYYRITDSDSNAPDSSFNRQRNLSFASKNYEGNLQVLLYLKKYRSNYYNRWAIDPYLGVGVGLTKYNPTANLNGITYKLRSYQTEGVKYGKFTFLVPLSLGLKLKLNEFINFNLELGFRYTFTDYLDDVSTVFLQQDGSISSRLSNRKNEIIIDGEPMVINEKYYNQMVGGSQRGNQKNNDSYLLVSWKLELYLTRGKGSSLLKKHSSF